MGEVTKEGEMVKPPAMPRRSGAFSLETTTEIGETEEDIRVVNKVRMPNRPMHKSGGKDNGWFELLDDFEMQILTLCDGATDVQDMMKEYVDEDGLDENDTRSMEFQQNLFSNIMRRLTRLYEYGFISW